MGSVTLKYWKELAIVVLLAIIWFQMKRANTEYVVENYYHEIVKTEVVEREVIKYLTKDKVKIVDRVIVQEGGKTVTTEKEQEVEKVAEQSSESTRVEKREASVENRDTIKRLLPKYHISGSYRPSDKSVGLGLEVRLGDTPVFIGGAVGLTKEKLNYQMVIGVEL
jgi:hypothetical protein